LPSSTRLGVALSLAVSIALTATQGVSAAPQDFSKTVHYLDASFVAGKFVEGFSPGQPDYGFTLEAMLQRKAAGETSGNQQAAIAATLLDNKVIGTPVSRHGYVFDGDGSLNIGAAAKYLFVGRVVGAANGSNRNGILALLKSSVHSDGSLISSNGNAFDYGWAVLALEASGEISLASKVAIRLTGYQHKDGGFGLDASSATIDSSTDATGIALQALGAVQLTGSSADRKTLAKPISRAVSYLLSTEVAGNHWNAWGDFDSNGTAYAAMGLKAVGKATGRISSWLASKISSDGGIETAWSGAAGDRFATAQGFCALRGISYIGLIGLRP